MFKSWPWLFAVFGRSQSHLDNLHTFKTQKYVEGWWLKFSEKFISTEHDSSPTFVHFDQSKPALLCSGVEKDFLFSYYLLYLNSLSGMWR